MLIQLNAIHINEVPEDKSINNLGDDTWYIVDSRNELVTKIHWDTLNSSKEMLVFAQNYIRHWVGGYADNLQRLYFVPTTVQHRLRKIERLIEYVEEKYPNKKLCHLSIDEVYLLMQDLIAPEGCKEPNGRGQAEVYAAIIRQSQQYYIEGLLTDGFNCDLPINLIDASLQDYLTGKGFNFQQWRKGGSWGGIPISVAMLLLADCIETLRSDTTKSLLAVFDDIREHQNPPLFKIFRPEFNKVIDPAYSGTSPNMEKFLRLKKRIEEYTGKSINRFPMKTQREFTSATKNVYDAALMLCLLVTGGRIGEITGILADEIERDDNGDWWFKSAIHKTNKGIKDLRAISGLAAEAVDIAIGLSMFDKVEMSLPVFLFAHDGEAVHVKDMELRRTTMTMNGYRNRLKRYYEDFLNKCGNEVREAHPEFKPHNTRHTWADFALRRFEGNVLEEIRDHFRHKYGSYHTKRYTDEKLSPHVQQLKERQYLEEIIHRIAGDEGDEFHGATALYIKKRLEETHEFIGDDELSSIDILVDEIADEFVRLVPHEWGFCVLREATKVQAKCFDRKAKIPRVDEGSSFDNCSGCMHRLTHNSHKEDVVRIAIAHNDFINNYPLGSASKKQSESTLKRAKAIIKEIESGPV